MAYQALYRQWRPQTFSAVVSQEAVITTLRNQVMNGRIAHAYLFCGSRGTGKTSTAKILSRAINCEHPQNGDPCGECPACRMLLAEESLDVTEIDAASNNGVEEMRDLRDTVKYPPQNVRYKVYIIDEVHMLSVSAFNALLKTLEEPPAHAVFILATTEPQKLPATILSRCQRYDFGRIPAAQIVGRLQQAVDGAGATADEAALHMIARAAEGGMRDALSILDMCLGYQNHLDEALVHRVLGTSDRSFLFHVTECLQNEDPAGVLQAVNELMRTGHEPSVFAKDLSEHVRALLLAKCCGNDLSGLLDLTKEDADEYLGQADGFTESRLMRILEYLMAVETELRYAASPRIALETAMLKACLSSADVDVQALQDRIRELEQKVAQMGEQLRQGVVIQAKAETAAAKPKAEAKKQETPQQVTLTPTGRSAADAWKEAMAILKKEAPAPYSMLTLGKLQGCEGSLFRWEAPLGQDFYCVALNKESNRSTIASALTTAMGIECTFEAVKAGSVMTESAQNAESRFEKEMTEIFGAANFTVQDH